MIEESHDNQMNDTRISTNWRVNISYISANSRENHMYVILSPNYAYSASIIDVKFTRWAVANQSTLWHSLSFPWFFGQFSNSLTFPSFLGSMTALIHGFSVMEYWIYCGSNLNTQSISEICLYAFGNHIVLFSAFLATYLITIFLKNFRRKIRVFRSL